MAAVHESIINQGGAVIGIAPAAAFQAKHLMASTIPFPLFIDHDQHVSKRLDVGGQSMVRFVFNLGAWWRYLKALVRGSRQGRVTGHYSNLPGLCVVDAAGVVTYVHRGSGIGDYPDLSTILHELANAGR